MSGIFERAMREKISAGLEEMRQVIEDIINNDGEIEDLIEYLESRMDFAEAKKFLQYSQGEGWDFDKEKAMPVFAENDSIRLRPLTDEDREFFLHVRKQWSERLRQDRETDDVVWESSQHKNSFYCIAEDRSGEKLGYIALKDTTINLWEVAIELEEKYCYRRYGESIVMLFLEKVREITGKTQFQALVEVENTASQKCLRKMGAQFVDTWRFDFFSEEEAEAFEEQNLDKITPQMTSLAEELGVEPRELLSHVLDYRIILK